MAEVGKAAQRICCDSTIDCHHRDDCRGFTIWHAPRPGPGYWDWRCLVCSQPVSHHASWWRRLWRRLTTPPGEQATP